MSPLQDHAGVVELPLPTGTVVRGRHWRHGPDSALLIHEPGGDLDAWDNLPELLHGDGLSVLAIDLPGHGLSDDPWQPDALPDVIAHLVESVPTRGNGARFIVGAGLSATAVLLAPPAVRIMGIVAFSPVDTGHDLPADRRPPARPKLVLVGAHGGEAGAARGVAKRVPGWCAVSTFPTAYQGSALLASAWGAQAREQTLGFLRDCRRRRALN